MQIKADFTREQLLEDGDPLFETCRPLEKLNAVASLLFGYAKSSLGMDESTIEGIANIIEDAVEEVEYLIDISNEQQRRDREKLKAANILQAMNS